MHCKIEVKHPVIRQVIKEANSFEEILQALNETEKYIEYAGATYKDFSFNSLDWVNVGEMTLPITSINFTDNPIPVEVPQIITTLEIKDKELEEDTDSAIKWESGLATSAQATQGRSDIINEAPDKMFQEELLETLRDKPNAKLIYIKDQEEFYTQSAEERGFKADGYVAFVVENYEEGLSLSELLERVPNYAKLNRKPFFISTEFSATDQQFSDSSFSKREHEQRLAIYSEKTGATPTEAKAHFENEFEQWRAFTNEIDENSYVVLDIKSISTGIIGKYNKEQKALSKQMANRITDISENEGKVFAKFNEVIPSTGQAIETKVQLKRRKLSDKEKKVLNDKLDSFKEEIPEEFIPYLVLLYGKRASVKDNNLSFKRVNDKIQVSYSQDGKVFSFLTDTPYKDIEQKKEILKAIFENIPRSISFDLLKDTTQTVDRYLTNLTIGGKPVRLEDVGDLFKGEVLDYILQSTYPLYQDTNTFTGGQTTYMPINRYAYYETDNKVHKEVTNEFEEKINKEFEERNIPIVVLTEEEMRQKAYDWNIVPTMGRYRDGKVYIVEGAPKHVILEEKIHAITIDALGETDLTEIKKVIKVLRSKVNNLNNGPLKDKWLATIGYSGDISVTHIIELLGRGLSDPDMIKFLKENHVEKSLFDTIKDWINNLISKIIGINYYDVVEGFAYKLIDTKIEESDDLGMGSFFDAIDFGSYEKIYTEKEIQDQLSFLFVNMFLPKTGMSLSELFSQDLPKGTFDGFLKTIQKTKYKGLVKDAKVFNNWKKEFFAQEEVDLLEDEINRLESDNLSEVINERHANKSLEQRITKKIDALLQVLPKVDKEGKLEMYASGIPLLANKSNTLYKLIKEFGQVIDINDVTTKIARKAYVKQTDGKYKPLEYDIFTLARALGINPDGSYRNSSLIYSFITGLQLFELQAWKAVETDKASFVFQESGTNTKALKREWDSTFRENRKNRFDENFNPTPAYKNAIIEAINNKDRQKLFELLDIDTASKTELDWEGIRTAFFGYYKNGSNISGLQGFDAKSSKPLASPITDIFSYGKNKELLKNAAKLSNHRDTVMYLNSANKMQNNYSLPNTVIIMNAILDAHRSLYMQDTEAEGYEEMIYGMLRNFTSPKFKATKLYKLLTPPNPNRRYKIEIVNVDGYSNSKKDNDIKETTSKLENYNWLRQQYLNWDKGFVEFMRTETGSSAWGYRVVNNKGQAYKWASNKKEAFEVFEDFLKGELAQWEAVKDKDNFKYDPFTISAYLSDELKEKLKSTGFEANREEVRAELRNALIKVAEDTDSLFREYGITDLKNVGQFGIEYKIHQLYSILMFYGDLNWFGSKFFKRSKPAVSTGTANTITKDLYESITHDLKSVFNPGTTGSLTAKVIAVQDIKADYSKEKLENFKNKVAASVEKYFQNSNIPQKDREKFEGLLMESLNAYTDIEVADGQSWVSLDLAKSMLITKDKWETNGLQKMYDYEVAFLKMWKQASEDLKDRYRGKNNLKLEDEIAKLDLTDKEKELLLNKPKGNWISMKWQYFGPIKSNKDVEAFNPTVLLKTSFAPVIPSAVVGTKAEQFIDVMYRDGHDIITIKSAMKTGIAEHGSASLAPFYTENGVTQLANEANRAYEIYLPYLKEQIPTTTKIKKVNLLATQFRKLLYVDTLIPTYDNKGNYTHNQWIDETIKELFEEFIDIQDEIVEIETRKLFSELKIKKVGNEYIVTDLRHLINTIKDEMNRQGKGDKDLYNLLDAINKDEANFDYSGASQILENFVGGLIKKRLARIKLPGNALILKASPTTEKLDDDGFGLNYYEYQDNRLELKEGSVKKIGNNQSEYTVNIRGKEINRKGYKISLEDFPNAELYLHKENNKWSIDIIVDGETIVLPVEGNTIKEILENLRINLNKYSKVPRLNKQLVKQGVEELFESDPELANSVYEALGFKQEGSNIEILTSNYTRQSVQNDVNTLYLFTDNAQRTSRPTAKEDNVDKNSWYYKKYKSQTNKPIHFGSTSNPTSAVIRGLNNAYPISTMSAYGTNWTNYNFDLFKQTIDDEINQIKQDLPKFDKVKIGNFRIGQGGRFAKLPQQHQEYLDNKLLEIGIDNTGNNPKIINKQITPQQKQQAQQKFQEYVNATGKQDIEGFKEFVNNKQLVKAGIVFGEAKVTKAECKISISQGEFSRLLNRADVRERALSEREDDLVRALNELIAEGKIPENLITIFGYRIPTSGLNLMDSYIIKEFLPYQEGSIIIVPPEAVIKAGEDYDIDKKNFYFPSITVKGKELFDISEEEFAKRKANIAIQKKALEEEYKELVNKEFEIPEGLTGEQIDSLVEDLRFDRELDKIKMKEKFTNFVETNEVYKDYTTYRTKYLTNKLIENAVNSSSHPARFYQLVTPVSDAHVKTSFAAYGESVEPNLWETTDIRTSSKKRLEMVLNGQALTGFEATDAVALQVMIKKGIRISKTSKLGKTIYPLLTEAELAQMDRGDYFDLSNPLMFDGTLKSDVFNQYTQATIDSASSPILAPVNITKDTIPVMNWLTIVGIPVNRIGKFLTQPILRERQILLGQGMKSSAVFNLQAQQLLTTMVNTGVIPNTGGFYGGNDGDKKLGKNTLNWRKVEGFLKHYYSKGGGNIQRDVDKKEKALKEKLKELPIIGSKIFSGNWLKSEVKDVDVYLKPLYQSDGDTGKTTKVTYIPTLKITYEHNGKEYVKDYSNSDSNNLRFESEDAKMIFDFLHEFKGEWQDYQKPQTSRTSQTQFPELTNKSSQAELDSGSKFRSVDSPVEQLYVLWLFNKYQAEGLEFLQMKMAMGFDTNPDRNAISITMRKQAIETINEDESPFIDKSILNQMLQRSEISPYYQPKITDAVLKVLNPIRSNAKFISEFLSEFKTRMMYMKKDMRSKFIRIGTNDFLDYLVKTQVSIDGMPFNAYYNSIKEDIYTRFKAEAGEHLLRYTYLKNDGFIGLNYEAIEDGFTDVLKYEMSLIKRDNPNLYRDLLVVFHAQYGYNFTIDTLQPIIPKLDFYNLVKEDLIGVNIERQVLPFITAWKKENASFIGGKKNVVTKFLTTTSGPTISQVSTSNDLTKKINTGAINLDTSEYSNPFLSFTDNLNIANKMYKDWLNGLDTPIALYLDTNNKIAKGTPEYKGETTIEINGKKEKVKIVYFQDAILYEREDGQLISARTFNLIGTWEDIKSMIPLDRSLEEEGFILEGDFRTIQSIGSLNRTKLLNQINEGKLDKAEFVSKHENNHAQILIEKIKNRDKKARTSSQFKNKKLTYVVNTGEGENFIKVPNFTSLAQVNDFVSSLPLDVVFPSQGLKTNKFLNAFNKALKDKFNYENPIESNYFFSYKGKTVPTPFELSQEQTKALIDLIEHINNSTGEVDWTLEAKGGAGKTSLIGIIGKYFEDASVLYAAPTHAATVQLALATMPFGNKNFPFTLRSSVTEDKAGTGKLTKKARDILDGFGQKIMVIDEASMVKNSDYRKIIQAAKREGIKVIFLGDPKQWSPIGEKTIATPFLHNRKSILTKSFRQGEGGLIDYLTMIRTHITAKFFKTKDSKDLKFLNPINYNKKIVEMLRTNAESVTLIFFKNKSVENANIQARKIIGRTGSIQNEDIIIGYLGYANKQIIKGNLANSVKYVVKNVLFKDGKAIIEAYSKDLDKVKSLGVNPNISTTVLPMSKDNRLDIPVTDAQIAENKNIVITILNKVKRANEMYSEGAYSDYESYLNDLQEITAPLSSIELMEDYVLDKGELVRYNEAKHGLNSRHSQKYKYRPGSIGSLIIKKGIDYGHAITSIKAQGMTIENVFYDPEDSRQMPYGSQKVYMNGELYNTKANMNQYVIASRAKNLFVKDVDLEQLVLDEKTIKDELDSYGSYEVLPSNNQFAIEHLGVKIAGIFAKYNPTKEHVLKIKEQLKNYDFFTLANQESAYYLKPDSLDLIIQGKKTWSVRPGVNPGVYRQEYMGAVYDITISRASNHDRFSNMKYTKEEILEKITGGEEYKGYLEDFFNNKESKILVQYNVKKVLYPEMSIEIKGNKAIFDNGYIEFEIGEKLLIKNVVGSDPRMGRKLANELGLELSKPSEEQAFVIDEDTNEDIKNCG